MSCQDKRSACLSGPLQAEALAQLPTFYAEDTPASANELWSRLHSDPLFAVRPARQLVSPLAALLVDMARRGPFIMQSAC